MNTKTEQLNILKKHFKKLKYVQTDVHTPEGFEGVAVIPKWQKVAKTYPEACRKVWDLLKEKRSPNWCGVIFDDKHIRRLKGTDEALVALDQKGDFYTLSVQMGTKHKGKSVNDARNFVAGRNDELLLGVFEVGCILLTHPEILKYRGVFEGIDCSGDEYAPGGGGAFSKSLGFLVYDGEFGFDWGLLDGALDYFGTAAASLPQKSILDSRPLETFDPSALDLPKKLVINGVTYEKK